MRCIHADVAALINGRRSIRTIVEVLGERAPMLEVLQVLRDLEGAGLIREVSSGKETILKWRDAPTEEIAPALLALLQVFVSQVVNLAEDDCPVFVYVAMPARLQTLAEPEVIRGDTGRHADNDGRASVAGLRMPTSGRGVSKADAMLGCLAEAAEVISATFRGDEVARRARLSDLRPRAVSPSELLLYSRRQYRGRNAWNRRYAGKNSVPARFDARRATDWLEARVIGREERRFLPAAYCLLEYPAVDVSPRFCRADTNGCAVGRTRDEAIVRGLLELFERDAASVWWYGRIERPAIELSSLEDAELALMEAWLHERSRTLHVLDLTNDLNVPTVVALSADRFGDRIAFGFGAHLDPRLAVRSAVTEMFQFLAQAKVLEQLAREGRQPVLSDEVRQMMEWWSKDRLRDHRFLRPLGHKGIRFDRPPGLIPNSSGDALSRLLDICETKELTPLVADLTRDEIGIPAVRVAVPGLRHFWARFAPGRLYDVPVRQGWRSTPAREEELNRTAIFM